MTNRVATLLLIGQGAFYKEDWVCDVKNTIKNWLRRALLNYHLEYVL